MVGKNYSSKVCSVIVTVLIIVLLIMAQNVVNANSIAGIITTHKSIKIDVPEDLKVTVSTDKLKYFIGEPVQVIIKLTNTGDEDITIEFPNSQLADFSIVNENNKNIYLWSNGKGFPDVITPLTILGGETVKLLNDDWDQVDNSDVQVSPGNYRINGWMVKYYWNGDIIYPEIHGVPIDIDITKKGKMDMTKLQQGYLYPFNIELIRFHFPIELIRNYILMKIALHD